MKQKNKTAAAEKTGKTSEPTGQAAHQQPVRQKKHSSHLESSVQALSHGRFDPVIVRNGEIAYSLYFDVDNGRYAIGGVATKTRKDLLGTKKRVPDDQYVCRALSQYLQTRGIKDVSSSTIYDWMRANETREAMGGKDKAPKISISFYVAVSRDDIPMKKRREYLNYAIKNSLTVEELKEHINGGKGAGEVAAANGQAISDIATAERTLSESQSLLSGKYAEFLWIDPNKKSWTIDRLENFAVYIWQLRDDIAKGGAKKGGDE